MSAPAELIDGAVRAASRSLQTGLRLRERTLPEAFSAAQGTWRGETINLETRAFSSEQVRYARVVTIRGGDFAIGNILVVGEPEYALPILGVDVVWLGTRSGAMIAADLSPTLPPGALRDTQLAPLVHRTARCRALPPGGLLPEWCARWFSELALYVRPGPGELPTALSGVQEYVGAFIDLANAAAPDDTRIDATLDAQHGYAASHREDDRGLALLAKVFGAEWAQRYIAEVLFPAVSRGNPEARSPLCSV